MEPEQDNSTGEQVQPASEQVRAEIDPVRIQLLMQKLRDEQSLTGGLLAGICAALAGAVLWAAITYAIHYQIGFMAIGVGLLVGLAVRKVGRGIDMLFGIVGAALALLGCLVGNLLAACASIAEQYEMGIWEVVSKLDFDGVVTIVVKTFDPADLFFYAIAIYAGYKYSFHRLTQSDVQGLLRSA